jgi:hypothetical protein
MLSIYTANIYYNFIDDQFIDGSHHSMREKGSGHTGVW